MIGMQFVDIGGGELPMGTAAILDSSMAGFDDEGTYITEIHVWNGVGYNIYGWSGTSGTEYLEDPSYDNQWLNDQLEPLEVETFPKAQGVWLKAGSKGSVTIAGEVPTDKSVTVELNVGWNMVANPFPGDVKISSFGMLSDDMAGFDDEGNYITEMHVWNGVGYNIYGWSGTSGTEYLEDPSYDNKWLNDQLEIPEDNVVLPYGRGVWIKAGSSGSITFTK
ncbi:MAG: hypothetical protein IJ444_05975 [Kiritimatiellae bacterium]|nr:hypothetical protein [Kiritimatiellia bacterium]